MRFLIYLLTIIASVTFFVYKKEAPITISNNTTPSEDISETASSTPKEEVKATSTTKIAVQKPKTIINQKDLDAIQQKIDEANQTLKVIEEKNTPLPPRLSQQELYDKASSRVVNFFCEYTNGVETASGVIISPDGYVLTNAHVAEAFLNKNYECKIRQGSPAKNIAYAKIVMFPKAYTAAGGDSWEGHANDVSIWKITRMADGEPVTKVFPYYEIDPNFFPKKDQSLATFSYPGELLGYEVLLKNLNMLFGETIVKEFNADFISSGMSLSSQSGSSGGVLVDIYTNKFSGLIFGVTSTESINERKLFSLTPYAIDRVVKNETGLSLADFLNN